jgi:hypothetical protein
MPKFPGHATDRVPGHRKPVTGAVWIVRDFHDRSWQKILEPCGYADRSRAGSAAAMGRREGLVQIVMHDVEAEIAGTHDADNGVHVGAVSVDQPAASVHKLHDLPDMLLEKAERVRIGHHDARESVIAGGADSFQIDIAAPIGRSLDCCEASHGGRSRIRSVGGIGNEDAGPLDISALAVVGAHHQEAGEFAVRSGRGLQRDACKATDFREPLLQFEHQRKIALHGLRRLQRVGLREAREPGDYLVDLRVEFHRAGAKRIEA